MPAKFIEATSDGRKPEADNFSKPCWENLASYHCPFCSCTIEETEQELIFLCTKCTFKITRERYDEILENLENRF